MKLFVLLLCLLPCVNFAAQNLSKNAVATYQQLCAKEIDPVKRHHYCSVLENNTHLQFIPSALRKDTALV